MNNISYSTLGFEDRSLEAALDGIAAAGFQQVELLGHTPHLGLPVTDWAASALRAQLERRGFKAWTIHGPFRRHALGAPEAEWREEVIVRTISYIRAANAIGARALIIHPVPDPSIVSQPSSPETLASIAAAVEHSLDDLTPALERAGVRLLLENLPYHCAFPYMTMAELRPLVLRYPVEAVGLVFDSGHAGTSRRDPAAEIRLAGDRLWGTHLHDVDAGVPDDQHWPPGQGGLDWQAIRAALLEIHYAGMWTFEVAHGRHGESPDELARYTYQWAIQW